MQQVLSAIRDVLKFHKLKIAAALFFTVIFAILLFPYSDLVDLISIKVSQATQNQVYLQMDALGLSIWPGPGMKMDNVVVETPSFPTISADRVAVTPSILGLLSFSPGFSARAEGIFKGNLNLTYRSGKKAASGQPTANLDVAAQGLALNALSDVLRDLGLGDVHLQGTVDMQSKLAIDPGFKDQPRGTVDLAMKNFDMPSHNVNTALGPLQIPELRLQKASVKGNLSDGRIALDNVALGSDRDELHGTIKGDLGLAVHNVGGSMITSLGGYDLRVELNMNSAFQKQAALFLMVLDSYKTQTPNGYRYAFRAQASDINMPPKLLPYR